ncbi:MAG: FAD:protein FMN transferase [Devosia sp.]|nr:FAD:protein FMN transferase [Devosia sp.]
MRTEPRLVRRVLNGPTMGTRFAAVFFTQEDRCLSGLQLGLQQAVDRVDNQMSTWKPRSDLMQLNAAPVGTWLDIPRELATVLSAALEIGRLSDGAFDIGVGDLVIAWGFGPAAGAADDQAIANAAARCRTPAHLALELDQARHRIRKHAAIALDLSGIAKGFGVDELARVLDANGIASYLVSIDGELRAGGPKPDGSAWRIAIEQPEPGRREAALSVELVAAALATSGDYRHVVEHGGRLHAHTMDPLRRVPLVDGPAAVTTRASTCMVADAWATALMVLGPERGSTLADALGIEALFAERCVAPAASPRSTPQGGSLHVQEA